MANVSVEEDRTSKLDQALSAPPAVLAELFSALNIFLSITAAVGNALILIALKNISSIHPPTKLFFRCLTVTDLCVGVIAQPLYAIMIFIRYRKSLVDVFYYVYKINGALSYILCGVSVLTSTAISVDRLIALLLGLRYRHVVTLRRVRVVITCVWIIANSGGLLWVWRSALAATVASAVLILCLAMSIFCYTRIHLKLRHQQAQVQNYVPNGQQNEEEKLNIARYNKTVSSIMWVQLALVVCYVPWGIVAALNVNGIKPQGAYTATSTLLYLNSSLNPILYCWKIREVKQSVKGTLRQLFCF